MQHNWQIGFITIMAAGLVLGIVHSSREEDTLKKLPVVPGYIEAIEDQMSIREGKIFILTFVYKEVAYRILEDIFPDSESCPDKCNTAKAGDVIRIYVNAANPYLSFSEFNSASAYLLRSGA